MSDLAGVSVSAGWMAGVRAKAAGRLEPFMDHVRALLRPAGMLYADESPARAAGHLGYVRVACTGYLTALHTGGRSAADIDAGGVLDGYGGVIVRDGYAGYDHLTAALHARYGAHNLRDLRDLYTFDPEGQVWARSMADLLITANAQATAARAAGQARLADDQLAQITAWYRGAVAKGISDNQGKRSKINRDGLHGCAWRWRGSAAASKRIFAGGTAHYCVIHAQFLSIRARISGVGRPRLSVRSASSRARVVLRFLALFIHPAAITRHLWSPGTPTGLRRVP
jgi:hypothetical protein